MSISSGIPGSSEETVANLRNLSGPGLLLHAGRFQLGELKPGQEQLVEYRFNTGAARHFFCGTCGIKSFYVPRSHPDGISVNARCLDPGQVRSLTIRPFDGQNWETARKTLED